MDAFVGREKELQLLEAAYRGRTTAFIPIYGRRRVGKSELILRFLREKGGIYYLGKQAQAGLQLREFLRESADALGEPLLASAAIGSWKEALQAVGARWKGPAPLVVALDEFQWMVEASPELPSVLQELLDRDWKAKRCVILILCGSLIGFMERELLGKKSPLFGRRTAQIHLRPFGWREAARFHPSYSAVDRARTYFVCGGIPLYLKYFSPERSVERNLVDTLLEEHAPLRHETEFLLREELREVQSYHAVLMELAASGGGVREIGERTGLGPSVSYYLHQLEELGYVARRHPLTGRRPPKHRVRYGLADPLLRFWFRFVYPNTSTLLQRGARRAFASRVQPQLEAYFGACFERFCREVLPEIYEREGVTTAFEIGEYWDRTTQIDVVGIRDDGWADIGECRWGRVPSPKALWRELDGKVARFPNPRRSTIGRRLFTRTPVTQPDQRAFPARWHDIEEIYSWI